MNKSELVAAVAEQAGCDQKTVSEVLSAFESVVTSQVAAGEKVALTGFLTFEKAHRAARTGKNPSTGEALSIAAKDVPKVKIGKAFKDAVG